MALNVVNGTAGQVIQNAGSWYAYDSQSVFMPYGGGTFNVTLGTTQDDVTHVDYLPMRADLQSVTGDGSNLTFSFTGDGTVDVHVKTPGANILSVLASAVGTGAGPVSATLVGDDLSLVFNDGALAISSTSPQGVPVLHTVTITEGPTAVSGATFIFNAPAVAITGTAAGQAITDLTTIAPFSKVTIADSNISQTETVTVTLSAAANGKLSNLGGGSYNATTGVYIDTGTSAVVTAALDALVFTPNVNQVAPGSTVTTGFAITDTDTAGTKATDSTTTVVATDVAVPPTISGTVAGQLTSDRKTIAPFSKVTIGDLNPGQTETVTVTISSTANGALSDLIGGSYKAGVYTDTGTAAAVTAALDALVFTPAINQVMAGQTVTTTFTIADTDTALATATDSTTTVVATDVGAPTLTVPPSTTVNQGATTLIAGLSLAEIANVTGETFTVTLADKNGLLSAIGKGVSGSGTTSLTISASLATVNSDLATLSDTDATTPSDTITLNAVDSFGVAAAPQSIAVTVTPAPPQTYTLTTGRDTVAGGVGNNTIIAKTNTLTTGDNINGGTGTNTLQLVGGGSFNLAAPTTLTNIAFITAQEGASGTTAQTVTLRAGLNATVNVASDPAGGITIFGATNGDVINLGAGNDTITLGSGETVNGGAGTDVYNVTNTTIANVTINSGTGSNTLVVNGGGNATMGSKITGINAVQLATTTNFTSNTTAGLKISGSSTGGDTITLGAPTQSVIAGGPNETITATAANAEASISGLGANSTLDITAGGTTALSATTDVSTVKLSTASMLTLNQMQFITAIGSSGNDKITAGGIDQTLTGGAGTDTLTGYAGGFDIFKDTAANLNGDTIQGFVASDTIDFTNLAYAGTDKVTTATSGANTKVTVTAGTTKSTFTLAGSWSASGFHLASAGATGTFLTHT